MHYITIYNSYMSRTFASRTNFVLVLLLVDVNKGQLLPLRLTHLHEVQRSLALQRLPQLVSLTIFFKHPDIA